jgi:hypothetical protein
MDFLFKIKNLLSKNRKLSANMAISCYFLSEVFLYYVEIMQVIENTVVLKRLLNKRIHPYLENV